MDLQHYDTGSIVCSFKAFKVVVYFHAEIEKIIMKYFSSETFTV